MRLALFPVGALMLAGSGLAGCVAAAFPVVASGVIAGRTVAGGNDGAGEPAPKPDAALVKTPLPAPSSTVASSAPGLPRRNRTEDFMAMALFAADSLDNGRSVIPDPGASDEGLPIRACQGQPAAILVDLDPGEIAFQPGDPQPVATAGLATALATARGRGLAVLWASVLDESRAQGVRDVLAVTGLDPARRDTLLLTRDPAETKTERRNAATAQWCIKAIVGDRRGDFDELMDYLRDPDAPTPFDPLLGNGWFELPPPLEQAA